MFDRYLSPLFRRLSRGSARAGRATNKLVRAGFECLESRSMLSLSPVDSGYRLEIDQLPIASVGEIAIAPEAVVASSTASIAANGSTDRSFDSYFPPIKGWLPDLPPSPPWPSPEYPKPVPTAPPTDLPDSSLPDSSDVGGFTDIGHAPQSGPEILIDPASDKVATDVAALLASLQYVPQAQGLGVDAAHHAALSPLARLPETMTQSPQAESVPEGGMVALVRDVAIVHSIPNKPAADHDLDRWLNLPVRMGSTHGKYQAFEVSTGEEAFPAVPPANNESAATAPHGSALEKRTEESGKLAPAALPSASSTTGVTDAGCESILDSDSSATLPPEAFDENNNSQSVAATALVLFWAARAARGARTADAREAHGRTHWTLRRPMRP